MKEKIYQYELRVGDEYFPVFSHEDLKGVRNFFFSGYADQKRDVGLFSTVEAANSGKHDFCLFLAPEEIQSIRLIGEA